MSSPQPHPVTIRHKVRLFRRNRRGWAVVEFALIAPLFFALLFAMLEYALMFLAGQVLETATQDAARLVQTGQAQAAGFDKDQFKQQLCDRLVALFHCETGVVIDVKSFPSFAAITPEELAPPITDGEFSGTNRYEPGNRNDIVLVRVYYPWQFYVTNLGFNVSNLSGGKRLLMASFASRNEPF